MEVGWSPSGWSYEKQTAVMLSLIMVAARQQEKATNPPDDSWSILLYELLCLWRLEEARSISWCPVIDFNVDPPVNFALYWNKLWVCES